MGRTRKRNKHLPPRVYERRGKLYYVHPVSQEWIPLPEGLRTWAKIVVASDAAETLSALWAKYDLEVLSKRATKTRRNRLQEWKELEKVFGAVNPADVEPHHVWRYWRDRGEIEQARHEVRCLSALLTYARQTGARKDNNPCFGLQLPSKGPRDRYITDDEYLAVRDLASPMLKYAMDLAYITGMSQTDLLHLERSQLLEDGILFDRQKTGKGQLIEWNDDLRAVIDDLKKERPELRRFLLCIQKGRTDVRPGMTKRAGMPFTSNGFQANWQRLLRKAIKKGVIAERFTFHDIRAKSLSDAKSLEEAQKRGGHADSKITQRVYRRLPVRAKAQILVVAQS
jgi:integrase